METVQKARASQQATNVLTLSQQNFVQTDKHFKSFLLVESSGLCSIPSAYLFNMDKKDVIREVLPKSGLVYSEKGGLAEILCKPKILPLKSAVLEQLQKIEQAADIAAGEEGQ